MFFRGSGPPSPAVDVESGWRDSLGASVLSPGEQRALSRLHTFSAGILPWVIIFMFLIGLLPFTMMVFSLLSIFCFHTVLRTLTLSAVVQRLQRLQAGGAGGVTDLARAGGAPPVISFGGHAINLLNLRLSLMDCEFGDSDYEVLLALDGGNEAHHGAPLTDAQLASLPTHKHSCGGGGSKGAGDGGGSHTCSVCLDDFSNGATVMTLPACRHQFHTDCMRKWLRQRGRATACPVCKTPVFSESGAATPGP